MNIAHEWTMADGSTDRLMSDGRLFNLLPGDTDWYEVEEAYPFKAWVVARLVSEPESERTR